MFSHPYCLNPPQHLLLRKETQTTSLFEQKPDFVAFVGKMLRRRSNKTQFGTPSESVKVIDLYLYLHELTQKCASIFLVDPIPPKEKQQAPFEKLTPPKINIEPENDGLEDVSPFPGVYSQVPC